MGDDASPLGAAADLGTAFGTGGGATGVAVAAELEFDVGFPLALFTGTSVYLSTICMNPSERGVAEAVFAQYPTISHNERFEDCSLGILILSTDDISFGLK